MALVLRPAAQKGLARIPKAEREALRDKLDAIAKEPYGTHPYAKRLANRPDFSVRQGDWRAVYRIRGTDVIVIEAGPRGSIYQ